MNEPKVNLDTLAKVVETYEKNKTSFQPIKDILSQEQLCYLIFKGAYSILAHKKSQEKKKEEIKDLRELKERISRDPEAAVKFGYGTRS